MSTNSRTHLLDLSPVSPLQRLANLYKAASDPLRLEILRVLRQDSFGVLELSHIFTMRQSGMSHHLKVLAKAGLVLPRREGNAIFYRRPLIAMDDESSQPQVAIYAAVDQLQLPQERLQRVAEIQQQRAEASRDFFSRYANKLQEQQELISDHGLYADAVKELLDSASLPSYTHAIEVGPGVGLFLPTLAKRFKKVVAVDICDHMLQQAESLTCQKKLTNIEFVHGELETLTSRNIQVDCIVMNMVLHHLPSPADMFSTCTRLLRPGGSLLISDLSRHEQSWVKERCGDLWLGFEAEDLTGWALKAGLEEREGLYLGLRNGFQVQVRRFLNSQENG